MAINSIGFNNSLFGQAVVNLNNQLTNLSTQLATGEKSTTYSGMGSGESFAIAARSQLSNISAFTTTITNVNTASVGASAVIMAGNNFSLLATTTNSATDTAEGSSDAVIPISIAETTVTITDTTSAAVGASAQITANGNSPTAAGTLSVKSDMSTTATSEPTVNTGGLGTDGQTNATLTISGNTTTDIGSNARLDAGAVSILAYVDTINAQAISDTSASALGTYDPARLKTVQKFYLDNNIIQTAVPVEDLYTNQFVTS